MLLLVPSAPWALYFSHGIPRTAPDHQRSRTDYGNSSKGMERISRRCHRFQQCDLIDANHLPLGVRSAAVSTGDAVTDESDVLEFQASVVRQRDANLRGLLLRDGPDLHRADRPYGPLGASTQVDRQQDGGNETAVMRVHEYLLSVEVAWRPSVKRESSGRRFPIGNRKTASRCQGPGARYHGPVVGPLAA